MQVLCDNCGKTMQITDDKVPRDKAFSVTCVGCKHKIRIDSHIKKVELYQGEEGKVPLDEYVGIDSMMISDVDFEPEEDESLEIYDEFDKVALIMDYKNEDAWSAALSGLEYKLQTAKTPEHGIHKLKFHEFEVVVLHEKFGEMALEANPLYKYIISMPMTSRRKAFVILVGKKFKSTDHMQAFSRSVNLVINDKDIDKLDLILRKSINENSTFYKIFRDTLHSQGKI